MRLEFVRSRYSYYSEKASDRVRQLSFAGIALIWLFKRDVRGEPQIPPELFRPALVIAVALALDFLHVVLGTGIWAWYNRRMELRNTSENVEFLAPRQINWPTLLLFWGKILAIVIAYVFIIAFLAKRFWRT